MSIFLGPFLGEFADVMAEGCRGRERRERATAMQARALSGATLATLRPHSHRASRRSVCETIPACPIDLAIPTRYVYRCFTAGPQTQFVRSPFDRRVAAVCALRLARTRKTARASQRISETIWNREVIATQFSNAVAVVTSTLRLAKYSP